MFFNNTLKEGSSAFLTSIRFTNCELEAIALSNCKTALYKGMCLAMSKTVKNNVQSNIYYIN